MSEQAERLYMWFKAWDVIKKRLSGQLHSDAQELVAALLALAED